MTLAEGAGLSYAGMITAGRRIRLAPTVFARMVPEVPPRVPVASWS
ncbi:hypothetical protein BZL30_9437 [Mycobacterium kansasii]|uniref:Uncharacterized protein n=1 Tax=Mycobacterium kansasii TaxID=1768 RepID=A0A1V3W9I6_MYCKA|nr:hypothetical protein BZL30_9437 [Mycobacterium kansasii]